MRLGALLVLALGLVSGVAHAAPVHTLDLSEHFSASPGTFDERRAVYDTLTVATSLQGDDALGATMETRFDGDASNNGANH